jgi:hypothetical protein
MDTHLNTRLRVGLFVLSVAAVGLVACGGYGTEPYPRQTASIGGGDSASVAIVGTWKHTVVFIDEYGMANDFSTIWTFDAGGEAIRNDITANVTQGVADTVITTGLWRVDSSLVVITFLQPSAGQLQMAVLVQGDVMFLGGQEFIRTTCCATPK